MTDLEQLLFFTTPEQKCGYLPDQLSTTLFVDPKAIISKEHYSSLSDLGFRRSGKHFYRPYCENCHACTPIRVNAHLFTPTKSQKRILKKNSEIKIQILSADFHEDHYLLYEKYMHSRHTDGDMYPPSRSQYRSFLVDGHSCTQFIEFSLDGHLCAIAVCDQLDDGLSAIYTFFDPDYSSLSLGKHAILWQIEEAKKRNLKYLYLGYFIKNCRKMAYKNQYSPFEARINNQWFTENQLEDLAKEASKNLVQ
jgi:arginine-tRNA-protein transferase|tara:strand:- start:3966 stop:4718 length:753 start_codon:yes stop_codon:yes gene_type:complete